MASLIQCTRIWATLGVGDGQGSLVCCSPWGCTVGHNWATEQQQCCIRFRTHGIWKLQPPLISGYGSVIHGTWLILIRRWRMKAGLQFWAGLWRRELCFSTLCFSLLPDGYWCPGHSSLWVILWCRDSPLPLTAGTPMLKYSPSKKWTPVLLSLWNRELFLIVARVQRTKKGHDCFSWGQNCHSKLRCVKFYKLGLSYIVIETQVFRNFIRNKVVSYS